MDMQSKICNKVFKLGRLQIHLKKTHKVDIIQYYHKYINPDVNTTCPICKKPKKFVGFKEGYTKTCGDKTCRSKYINLTYKQKQKDGCILRNKKWKNEIVDGKTKQQIIIENGSGKRKRKQKQTSLKISEALSKKDENGLNCIARSFLKIYGVTNPMHLPENVLKIRNTFKQKYDVDWITQSEDIKQKIRDSMISKYGVDNYSKSEESKNLMKERYKKIMFNRIEDYFKSNDLTVDGNIEYYYQNEKTPLSFICNKCKTKYQKCWNDIQSWWCCRRCNPFSNSSYEIELYNYLSKYISNIIKNPKILKNPITDRFLEVDLYCPDLNVAIEIDGLYWHSSEHQLNDNYHLMKTEISNNQGIQLIHIFEDEWCYKKEIVLSRISNLLHLSNLKRIHARQCIIKPVEFSQKKKFLDTNHIQGNDVSCVNLGLFYNNMLVSLMTFSKGSIAKGHVKQDGYFELSRFCNLCFHKIPGAASKLLSYFIKNYEWINIFSYADRRWSQGNVYYKLGFQLASAVAPNYWYMNKNNLMKRIHRFTFRKSNLKKMNSYDELLSEKDIMSKEGYVWIYDCGNLKFIMENK